MKSVHSLVQNQNQKHSQYNSRVEWKMSQIHNAQFSPVILLITWIWALILWKVNKFLVNKSIALLLTTSVLLALKCHNVDICQTTRAYALLEISKLAWGEVARSLGVSQSVISPLRTRLAQTNSTLDRRRSGRPRSTSQAQDRFLRTSVLRSRSVSAEQLRERLSRTGTRVSVQTVRNHFTVLDLELGDLT